MNAPKPASLRTKGSPLGQGSSFGRVTPGEGSAGALQANTPQWKLWGGQGAPLAPRPVHLPGSAGSPQSWLPQERAGRRCLRPPPQGAAAPIRATLGGGGGDPGRPCSLAEAQWLRCWRKRGFFVRWKWVIAVPVASLGAASRTLLLLGRFTKVRTRLHAREATAVCSLPSSALGPLLGLLVPACPRPLGADLTALRRESLGLRFSRDRL